LARLAPILDDVAWLQPELIAVRVRDRARSEYREQVLRGEDGRFIRFVRRYPDADARMGRVGLTTDPEIARLWQESSSVSDGWKRLRRLVRPSRRHAASIRGRLYSLTAQGDVSQYAKDLVTYWDRPDATIDAVSSNSDGVWIDSSAKVENPGKLVGPVWIGAGHTLTGAEDVVGPEVLWDVPGHATGRTGIRWQEIEALGSISLRVATQRPPRKPVKRAFDILFSLGVLAFTLPLYPIIAALIWLEDGRPIFFGHERETVGGRRFKCLKFRSMRRDAEKMKKELQKLNKADGPQFFIPDDPRLTRCGRILRDLQLDELPQFLNVIRGDMSIVGPRPSPYAENQYCPGWREARLSVRPGVTGLWQIMRTRSDGADFQEWIKYDIEYVEKQSMRLDLWIIWRTVSMLITRVLRP
jgi:lipopolysaccharide/colanic/teichoic acid biosynthesis glycosyltransferase